MYGPWCASYALLILQPCRQSTVLCHQSVLGRHPVESTLSESLKQSLTSTLLTSTLFKYFHCGVTRTSMLVPFHIPACCASFYMSGATIDGYLGRNKAGYGHFNELHLNTIHVNFTCINWVLECMRFRRFAPNLRKL